MKAYLVAHLVGTAGLDPSDIQFHLDNVRNHASLKERMNDMLNAEVSELFIPTRTETYSIQIIEFDVDGPNGPTTVAINLDAENLKETTQVLNACLKAIQEKVKNEQR